MTAVLMVVAALAVLVPSAAGAQAASGVQSEDEEARSARGASKRVIIFGGYASGNTDLTQSGFVVGATTSGEVKPRIELEGTFLGWVGEGRTEVRDNFNQDGDRWRSERSLKVNHFLALVGASYFLRDAGVRPYLNAGLGLGMSISNEQTVSVITPVDGQPRRFGRSNSGSGLTLAANAAAGVRIPIQRRWGLQAEAGILSVFGATSPQLSLGLVFGDELSPVAGGGVRPAPGRGAAPEGDSGKVAGAQQNRGWAVGGFFGGTTLYVDEGGGWDPTAPAGSAGFELPLGERWSVIGETTYSGGDGAGSGAFRRNYFIGEGKLRWALGGSERDAPYVMFGIGYLYVKDTVPSGRTGGRGRLVYPVGIGYLLAVGERWSIRPEVQLYLTNFLGSFWARYGVGVWYRF